LEEADLIVTRWGPTSRGVITVFCNQRIAGRERGRGRICASQYRSKRRTATTDLADVHLQIRPDAMLPLFNGLLAYLRRGR